MGFNFVSTKNAFIVYTVYVSPVGLPNNVKVKMYLEQESVPNPSRMSFTLHVFSIEELLDLKGELPASRYQTIPNVAMRQYYSFTQNENDEKYTVTIPLGIESVTVVTDNATQA